MFEPKLNIAIFITDSNGYDGLSLAQLEAKSPSNPKEAHICDLAPADGSEDFDFFATNKLNAGYDLIGEILAHL